MDEFALISRYFAPLAGGHAEALALSDDAALVEGRFVITTDSLQEGVHFLSGEHPADLARRLLRVNLSDIAAMGATPYCYLLTLGLPTSLGENWLQNFSDALKADQRRYGLFLAGGDTTNTQSHISLGLTALGTPGERVLTRANAQAGDAVYVSGTIGDSALGLRLMQGDEAPLAEPEQAFLRQRYRLPEPRVELGAALAPLAHAAMDISDGLVADAGHLAAASGCGMEIEVTRVPFSEAARRWLAEDADLLEALITGGDDYELLFTVPPDKMETVRKLADTQGLPLTQIGRVTEGGGVRVLDASAQPMQFIRSGYQHRF